MGSKKAAPKDPKPKYGGLLTEEELKLKYAQRKKVYHKKRAAIHRKQLAEKSKDENWEKERILRHWALKNSTKLPSFDLEDIVIDVGGRKIRLGYM